MLEMIVSFQTDALSRKAEIEERGATAVQYVLIVGLVAVAIIGSVAVLTTKKKSLITGAANTLP